MPMSDEEWAAFELSLGKNRGGMREAVRPLHQRRPTGVGIRRLLWIAQDGRCGICGEKVGHLPRTIDHVMPKSRGGADRVGNAVIAHRHCNEQKDSRLPTGCELIWLMAVNNRLGVEPTRW